ncbi:MAG: IS1634 family transposase [Dermatophilaceae bacterium]
MAHSDKEDKVEAMAPRAPVLVDPGQIECCRSKIAGLPVVNAVLERLGFGELVSSYLGEPDPRCLIAPTTAIGVLVRNLCLGREPLYGLGSWAQGFEAGLLGLSPEEAPALSDDCVGRALDHLFVSDRASMLTKLSLRAIDAYRIDCSELHDDPTSLALYGSYAEAKGEPRAGVTPPRPARGFSKDHRGDLKQLVWILTVTADGAVPITYRMADGNTEDSTTHITTWERCRGIAGHSAFLYVADSKLCTRDNMDHIAKHRGRFLTILPRTRKENETGRAWIASGSVPWAEVSRRPGKRKDDPAQTYWAAPAPSCSAEGYRITWFCSSVKRENDAASRSDRIEAARAQLAELATSLASSRCQLRSRSAVEDAAKALVAEHGAVRWVRFEVSDEVTSTFRQERRGRPGKDTRYKKVDAHRFSLASSTDAEAVAYDAACDGCFPTITNDTEMTEAELLFAYKRQPRLERRHATFKGVLEATPIELKSDYRIDAFGFCLYVALLVHALIERELRKAMAEAGIAQLPLYYENRPCHTPSAARVLELLAPLERTLVSHADEVLTVAAPELSPLQEQLLSLLAVPLSAYQA